MDESLALRWSRTYAVLPPALTSSKTLPGDKIILPHSALEQLLAAAPSRPPVGATFTSFDPRNTYNPGFLGSYGAHENNQQLPHPLMFRLVNPANNNVVYAGIREFSAPEGTLGLSPFLLEGSRHRRHGPCRHERRCARWNCQSRGRRLNCFGPSDYGRRQAAAQGHIRTTATLGGGIQSRRLEITVGTSSPRQLYLSHQRCHSLHRWRPRRIIQVPGGQVRSRWRRNLRRRYRSRGGYRGPQRGAGQRNVATDYDKYTIRVRKTGAPKEVSWTFGRIFRVKCHLGDCVDYVLPSWDRSQPLEIRAQRHSGR